MEKYIAVVINSIKKNLVYRSNNLITMISVLFSFIVLFYFWTSIYKQGNQIGSYSLSQMISYYVFVAFFQLLITGDNVAWSIGDEINSGQITSHLLKPINYLRYKFSQTVGNLLYRFAIFFPIIIVIILSLRNYLIFFHSHNLYLAFAVLALFSYIIYFLIYFSVGIVTFWAADSRGFYYTCWILINFMQGGLIPLDILPSWLSKILDYLPFKYLFFVPVSLISGKINLDYKLIVFPFLWCIIFYFLAQFLFRRGVKKYEGFGI